MLDLGHLPSSQVANQQVFVGVVDLSSGTWNAQIWQKPRGISMVHILALAGGGGGGGGHSRTAGTAGGGGGGGGSAATMTMLVPAYLLPDTLYLFVGAGAAGGAPDGNGGVAARPTKIYLGTAATAPGSGDILLAAGGLNTAASGRAGTVSSVGLGGTGEDTDTTSLFQLGTSGEYTVVAGQTGGNGGSQAGAPGTAIALPTNGGVCMAGAGGGGTTSADFAGGGFTASASSLLSDWRPVAPAAGSNNGSGGSVLWKPFFAFGGCGGSSSNTGVGGDGGNAGYGSGGGGGGAGTTGGRGGNGGPGIVIITAW